MFKLVLEKAEEPEIKLPTLPTSTGSSKKQGSSRKKSTPALLTTPKPLTGWITTNYGNSSRDGNTRPLDLPLQKSVSGQEATVRTGHGTTTDCFQIGKGVRLCYVLSPCLVNVYAEYIMRKAGLEEAQAGIKTAGRNINNLRYADDTTLMVKIEEELNPLDASERRE